MDWLEVPGINEINVADNSSQVTPDDELLLLLDLGLLLQGNGGGELLLRGRIVLHAAGAEPEVRKVTPQI